MKRYLIFSLAFFAVLLQLTAGAWAIGISPSRLEMFFEPNYNTTLDYVAINNKDESVSLQVYTTGDLNYTVTPDTLVIEDMPPQSTKGFSVALQLPESVERAGLHDVRIGVIEIMSGTGTSVTAKVAVESQLWIRVPYPGKYLEMEFSAKDAKLRQNAEFIIDIRNLGTEDTTVRARIEIYDFDMKSVANISLGEEYIRSKEDHTFTGKWPTADSMPGVYTARAFVDYEDKSLNSTKVFRIGYLWLDITNITLPPTIKSGDIVKMLVGVESFWADEVSGAYLDLAVTDENGRAIVKSRSENFNIDRWERKTVPIYWEANITGGRNYTGILTLHFSNITTSTIMDIMVERSFDLFWLIIISIVCSVAAVWIGILVIFRRRRHEKKIVF